MGQDYELDPRFTRDVIRAPERENPSREPPKVSAKYAREYIYNSEYYDAVYETSEIFKSKVFNVNTPPKFDPKFSREEIRPEEKLTTIKNLTPSNKESSLNVTDAEIYGTENKIFRMNGHQFEEYIVRLFQEQGLIVKHTMASHDGGLDGIVFFEGRKFGLQVKKYKSKIGGERVRTFLGSLMNAKLNRGIYITTSDYSIQAKKTAEKNNIVLISGSQIREWRLDLKSVLRRC